MTFNYFGLSERAATHAFNRLGPSVSIGRFEETFARMLGGDSQWTTSNALVTCWMPSGGVVLHVDDLADIAESKHLGRIILFDVPGVKDFICRDDLDSRLDIFIRTLRLAKKLWENLRLSIVEKPISGTNRYVMFPHPINTMSNERLVLERVSGGMLPREAVRIGASDVLFCFWYGKNMPKSLMEGPVDLKQLGTAAREIGKRVPELAEETRQARQSAAGAGAEEEQFSHDLKELRKRKLPLEMPYDDFHRSLTAGQQNFIERPVSGPEVLRGPAGSGKTLSLIMRTARLARTALASNDEFHIIFFTHNTKMKAEVHRALANKGLGEALGDDRRTSRVSVTVTTLQEWCTENVLERRYSDALFLDSDSGKAKDNQISHIEDALDEMRNEDLDTFKSVISKELLEFLLNDSAFAAAEMIRHEIAVMIKGRAEQNREKYFEQKPLKYGLPVNGPHDKALIWEIYTRYQDQLQKLRQFDVDDVVLTSIGRLDTPLWRRDRELEGYDCVVVDEIHHFNFNELSVFHFLTKSSADINILYSIDQSQAIGDRAIDPRALEFAIVNSDATVREDTLDTVFRCSPEIVRLAWSILRSGVNVFDNFENPVSTDANLESEDDLRLSKPPIYIEPSPGDSIEHKALDVAKSMAEFMHVSPAEILIVAFSKPLQHDIEALAADWAGPGAVLLETRGDMDIVKRGRNSKSFVLSLPDYVGGMEFSGVVLVGMDDDSFPDFSNVDTAAAKNYIRYVAHNHFYVAVTRARYQVAMIGARGSRPTRLLDEALDRNFIEVEKAT